MTNEEVIHKTKEEFKLRGLSQNTEDEYLGVLQRFLKYYNNQPLESWEKMRFESSCSI